MPSIINRRENRGGARPGAGRKPIYSMSEMEIRQLIKAARKKARETGKTPAQVLMDLAYQEDDKRTALGALRVYLEHTTVRTVEKNVNQPERMQGPLILSSAAMKLYDALPDEERAKLFPSPMIILPERKPDPAKELVKSDPLKAH